MVHCLPTVYIRRIDTELATKLAPSLANNVAKDMDWLEAELERGGGKYLVGDHVTAADTMMAFSIQFILEMDLGPKDRNWHRVEEWLGHIEAEKSYQAAITRTGHKL